MKKITNLFIVTMMFLFCFNMKSFAEPATWVQNKSLPALENGVTNWSYIDTNKMYVKSSWKEINSKWYYFNENGFMLASTTTPDGYLVNNNGEWVNGPGAYNYKSGNWNVSGKVIDDVMAQGNGLINVYESSAEYNYGDITLNKSGNEYTFDIKINLSKSTNRSALQQLSRLTAINGVGDLLLNDNDNEVYQLDTWQDMGNGHQVYVSQNGKTLTYKIK